MCDGPERLSRMEEDIEVWEAPTRPAESEINKWRRWCGSLAGYLIGLHEAGETVPRGLLNLAYAAMADLGSGK